MALTGGGHTGSLMIFTGTRFQSNQLFWNAVKNSLKSVYNNVFGSVLQSSPKIKLNSSSSSSSYWASVANAPNLLQPYWLIVLPLDLPDLTASLLLWGPSGQRWRSLWTFLFSNVPTFSTSRLQEILAAKGGTTWAGNGWWILPENARLPRNIQGSFTCRKSTSWDKRLYFPSEGRRAEDFFALENQTASVGFEPANLGTKGQHANSRPPKPLVSDCWAAYCCLYCYICRLLLVFF